MWLKIGQYELALLRQILGRELMYNVCIGHGLLFNGWNSTSLHLLNLSSFHLSKLKSHHNFYKYAHLKAAQIDRFLFLFGDKNDEQLAEVFDMKNNQWYQLPSFSKKTLWSEN